MFDHGDLFEMEQILFGKVGYAPSLYPIKEIPIFHAKNTHAHIFPPAKDTLGIPFKKVAPSVAVPYYTTSPVLFIVTLCCPT